MNATKRKFNALLNSIGTKPPPSASEVNNASQTDLTSSDSMDLQAKKRRVSGQSTTPKPLPTSRFGQTIKHKKSLSVANLPTSTEAPKYAPWDRADFLKRLKSFSNITDWTPKPARVNEVEWAKRGWVCQKFERVRCCLCNVEILVKLNRKEVDGKEELVYVAQNIGTLVGTAFSEDANLLLEDAIVEKYVELIVTSHNEDCLWRRRGCDDSIFKLPLNNASTTIANLGERYSELKTRKETLPYMFNMRTPPGFDVDTVIRQMPAGFFTTTPGEETSIVEINKVAFIMALFGWQGHTHERLGVQLGSVSCHACFRVLGLWIFKSKEINEAGEEVRGAGMNCLDVIKEHRDYCPWQNSVSQNGHQTALNSSTSSMAGWEIVLRILKNDHFMRTNIEIVDGMTTQPSAKTNPEASYDFGTDLENDDARSIRDEKDKERWARLRRVKSLFDTKGGKRLQAKSKLGA